RVSEAIVAGALLFVREHLVRLGRLLEAGLGLGVARVAVRVVLERARPVRFADVVRGCVLGDAEDLVIIAFFAHEDAGPNRTFVCSAGSTGAGPLAAPS